MIPQLLNLVLTVLVFGLIFWIIGQVPLEEPWKRICKVVAIVLFIIWLIKILVGLTILGY